MIPGIQRHRFWISLIYYLTIFQELGIILFISIHKTLEPMFDAKSLRAV